MTSPLATSPRTTCEESIIEDVSSYDFIRSEWALESYLPSSTSIHISSEVDKITSIWLYKIIIRNNILYHIYQVPLPNSSKLEKGISIETNCISINLDISIISESFFYNYSWFMTRCSQSSISEFCELFPYCRVEVSICLICHIQCKREHFFGIIIKYSSTRDIEIMEPIHFYKT